MLWAVHIHRTLTWIDPVVDEWTPSGVCVCRHCVPASLCWGGGGGKSGNLGHHVFTDDLRDKPVSSRHGTPQNKDWGRVGRWELAWGAIQYKLYSLLTTQFIDNAEIERSEAPCLSVSVSQYMWCIQLFTHAWHDSPSQLVHENAFGEEPFE